MKVLLDKKLADGIQVKVVLDGGKLVLTESADVGAYLEKLKEKVGPTGDWVIELVKAQLAGQ